MFLAPLLKNWIIDLTIPPPAACELEINSKLINKLNKIIKTYLNICFEQDKKR